jgi:actin-related protein
MVLIKFDNFEKVYINKSLKIAKQTKTIHVCGPKISAKITNIMQAMNITMGENRDLKFSSEIKSKYSN